MAMPRVEQRRIRVGIEMHGQTQFYEGLNISVSGTKYACPLQNECTVTIIGLNADTRNYLVTQASRFEPRAVPARITVEAGRQGGDLFLMYTGDAIEATVGVPPDLAVTIRSKTNNGNSAQVVVTQGRERMQLSALASEVARNNDLQLEFRAADKAIENYAYQGVASKQIQDLQEAGGVSAFVDDGILIVKDRDSAVPGRRRILNERSGMLGLPRATERGVEVTYLADGESLIGGQITIQSRFAPSLDGDYVIDQLKFDIRTHSDEFYYVANCRRLNAPARF